MGTERKTDARTVAAHERLTALLDDDRKRLLSLWRSTQRAASDYQKRASELQAALIHDLIEGCVPLRHIADALDLSAQRVHEISKKPRPLTPKLEQIKILEVLLKRGAAREL